MALSTAPPVTAALLAVAGLVLLGRISPHRRGMAVTGMVLLLVYAVWTPLHTFILYKEFIAGPMWMATAGSVLNALLGNGTWALGILLLVLAATRAPRARASAPTGPVPPGPPGPPGGPHYGPPAGYGPPPPPAGPPPAVPPPPAAR
ncbi:hypothetical protein [Nocardiopsis halophila]|uniref:hypothetical protein n=1 Tax=Nocardiopsis halophila TaxID=141692 RepID=UPI000349E479|nr:hypothetical protein [Nocardiopsis halophila]